MSCHDIGRGMNSVVEVAIDMYDDGELSLEAARKIIAAARKGVHWCDGNEYEAVDCIRECRCGRCLKKMAPGDSLYSVWRLSDAIPQKYSVLEMSSEPLASDAMCEECFDIVLGRHTGDPAAGPAERKRQIGESAVIVVDED